MSAFLVPLELVNVLMQRSVAFVSFFCFALLWFVEVGGRRFVVIHGSRYFLGRCDASPFFASWCF